MELLQACLEGGSAEAWQEFLSRYQRLIACTVLRVADGYGRREMVDDLVQDTLAKLLADNCANLRRFVPRREFSLDSYLQRTARSVALDSFKREGAQRRDFARTEALPAVSSSTRNGCFSQAFLL
jgi:DNA-directed RNA polymerase specialized sigma24 family protein